VGLHHATTRTDDEMRDASRSALLNSPIRLPSGVSFWGTAVPCPLCRSTLQAEVQSIFADGAPSIHTRSLKYGKLEVGTFVTVTPALVKRCKNHFHNLPCGVGVVLGECKGNAARQCAEAGLAGALIVQPLQTFGRCALGARRMQFYFYFICFVWALIVVFLPLSLNPLPAPPHSPPARQRHGIPKETTDTSGSGHRRTRTGTRAPRGGSRRRRRRRPPPHHPFRQR